MRAALQCSVLVGAFGLGGLRGSPADSPGNVLRKDLSLVGRSGGYTLMVSKDGVEGSLMISAGERPLLFVHIPKNAGSTVEDVGSAAGIAWGWHLRDEQGPLKLPGSQTMPDGSVCTGWHVPPAELRGDNPYKEADVFCVTRDPWERMRSEYVYLLSSKYGADMPFLRDGPECSREGFNLFVSRSLDAVASGRRWIDDCHLLPQWDFIESPDGTEWCPNRLPLANLTESFNALMASRGLQLQMKPEKSRSASHHCPDVSALRPAELYDAETAAKMRTVYARDFEHLGDSLET